ncbi:MAG TPA: motility associated factor glycosyltransferase family protein [Clostridiales bacterium]|nr:motility associated factor glycosyltransferase family protein [Clostridiales bacterium]
MNDQQLLLNNIELLKKHGYDESLVHHPVLDIEKNNQGYDNLRYETEDGKRVYLHSQYNLQREWQMIEKDLDIGSKDAAYIVYGLGLGYHIKELKSRISSRSYIYVIEKNLDIVSTYMHTQDFSEIAMGNIFFFFGNDEEILTRINEKIFAFNVMPLFGNLTNVILPSYRQIYGEWIHTIQKRILDAIRHAYFMLGNDMEDTIIGIKNNLENIDALLESPSIELLKDAYSNIPVIIVAAGPSLDKNIHELKHAQGKALIIATDAVLSTLKKHGVVPDGVVSIERGLLTYEKFYKDKEIHPKIVFIGPPVVRPEIFSVMKNNKKLICLKQGEKINEWINRDILGENRLLPMGTSCAHIAFSFARYVGANPIIFIGQDLAYTKDGITHSADVEIRDKIDAADNGQITFVKGIDGEMLPTSHAFKQFLTWFELEIMKEKGIREYVDATEGGAYIDGTKLMTLREAIERYCNQEVTPLYEKVPESKRLQEKYDKAVAEVEKLIESFEKIKDESNRQILRLDKLQTKAIRDKKAFSLKDREKICKVLNQAKKAEDMILGNDIARTLFQAPFMMAATKVRMLGNEATDEVLRENVVIQKKMVASFIIGCHSVLRALADILAKMKKEQEANE